MSSYFDEASLVMIPSGYKTSKLYSVKPTDGSGDMAFTRSNDTATRVGPDGLIEKVRTNLFLQSNGFDTASWSKSGATVTANQPDPFGGNNAFLVQFSGATTDTISQLVSMVSGTPYTLSVWIKGVDLTGLRVAIGANLVIVTSQVINGTWVRVSATQTVGSTGGLTNQIRAENSLGQSFYIYAAQLETGDIATDPILTTTAAVSVGPVANVPRLDYLNSSCPRLLLEPQRTNLVTFSEQIDNAAYIKLNTTVTSNATTSPTGYQDADKIIANTTNGVHNVNQSFSIGSSTAYTASIYAKKGEYSGLRINFISSANTFVSVNLNTGVIQNFGGSIYLSSSITSVGNDWYRVTMSFLPPVAVGNSLSFIIENPVGTASFAGDNTSGIFLWGAQLEVGAYATSYIPTLGAAVTRGADLASKTGISSLIGQTEGTLYAEVDLRSTSSTKRILYLSDGTVDNEIRITSNALNVGDIQYAVRVAGTLVVNSFTPTSVYTNGVFKIAAAYSLDDFVLYINGVQLITDTTGTVPACSRIDVGSQLGTSNFLDDRINQVLLFKTRLSNADLAALTTI